MNLFVMILIIALVAVIGFYVIKEVNPPHPFGMIAKVFLGVVIIAWLLATAGAPLPF